jgi:hypothetical protein
VKTDFRNFSKVSGCAAVALLLAGGYFGARWEARRDTDSRATTKGSPAPQLTKLSSAKLFDPALAYASFFGGPNGTKSGIAQGITASYVDSAGDLYVGGITNSASFPVTTGAAQTTNAQATQVGFVSKISSDGKTLIFSTYVALIVSALAVDSAGDVYVAGNAPLEQ